MASFWVLEHLSENRLIIFFYGKLCENIFFSYEHCRKLIHYWCLTFLFFFFFKICLWNWTLQWRSWTVGNFRKVSESLLSISNFHSECVRIVSDLEGSIAISPYSENKCVCVVIFKLMCKSITFLPRVFNWVQVTAKKVLDGFVCVTLHSCVL